MSPVCGAVGEVLVLIFLRNHVVVNAFICSYFLKEYTKNVTIHNNDCEAFMVRQGIHDGAVQP